MWGASSSPMSPAAIFLLPLPPGTPEQGAPALHGRGAHSSRAEGGALGLPTSAAAAAAAAAGCAGCWSRARTGGESRPRGGSRHPEPGLAGGLAAEGDAAIFNPMANRRPSCSVRRGAREHPPQRAGGSTGEGLGPWPGLAAEAEGESWVRRLRGRLRWSTAVFSILNRCSAREPRGSQQEAGFEILNR